MYAGISIESPLTILSDDVELSILTSQQFPIYYKAVEILTIQLYFFTVFTQANLK